MIGLNDQKSREHTLYMTATGRPVTTKAPARTLNVIRYLKTILNNLFRKQPSLNKRGVDNLYRTLTWMMMLPREYVITSALAQGDERVSRATIWLISGNIIVSFEYFDRDTQGFLEESISINPRNKALLRKAGEEYEPVSEDHPAVRAVMPMFDAFAIYCPFDQDHKRAI